MATKKQNTLYGKDVLNCLQCLKQAHNSPNFLGKTEEGKTIIIKFKNKVRLRFKFNEQEYSNFKMLERELWK